VSAWTADLEVAFRLADIADAISLGQFRSEELLRTHKVDGTPVSQIDFDVEEAMFSAVRAIHPDDNVIGEEIGPRRAESNRRWIFDGIDGTHNYSLGRPGWATAIALEAEGDVVVGLVSAPRFGRRWWATRGGGAWMAPYGEDGSFDPATAIDLHCGDATDVDTAAVMVMPWSGFMVGWRDEVTHLFRQPDFPRSESIVLDAVRVASAEVDATVLTLGSIWDFAAPSLILTEAGGVFRDAWGGERFDT
jgi:histidinol-phosphatase